MTLSHAIASAYFNTRFVDLPARVLRAATISLADGLSVMIAARSLEPTAHAFALHALNYQGRPEASLIGHKQKVPAPLAALANGALSHAIDFEDTFDQTGMHPNAALIPAVLALAEKQLSSGEDIIRALALGCDFTCRLSLALAGDPAARGWYHPPMLSTLGATLGAALLLDLSPVQIVDALSLATCQFVLNDELKRSPETHLRALRDGFAARAAIDAVLLAQIGVRGIEQPLEGQAGLFVQLTGAAPNAQALLGELGKTFFGPDVSLKRWPSCRGTHAAVHLGLELHAEGIAADTIQSVQFDVSAPDDMLLVPQAQKQDPQTPIEARFSIPFTFATALICGQIDLDSFSPECLRIEAVRALAHRTTLGVIVNKGAELTRISMTSGQRVFPLHMPTAERAGTVAVDALVSKSASCLTAANAPMDAAQLVATCLALPEDGLVPLIKVLSNSANPQVHDS